MTRFVNVLLPVPLQGTFTYSLPADISPEMIQRGSRVLVPFGKRHLYTAIVTDTNVPAPQGIKPREISELLDPEPIVRNPQLKFWNWVADYYLCTPGEVFKAALPAGLKVESETTVELNPDFPAEGLGELNERQLSLVNALNENGRSTIEALGRNTGLKNVQIIVGELLDKETVIVSERLRERYRARKKPYVRLSIERANPEALSAAIRAVKRSARQELALITLISLSGFNRPSREEMREVSLEELSQSSPELTRSVYKSMQDKGLVEIYEREISRFSYEGPVEGRLPELSKAQQRALNDIHASFVDHDVTLLHGVTGSGKTEIYIHLIDYIMQQGRQALFLVPEIALTTQLTKRLQRVFGAKVVIYHSKFSDSERVDIWRRMLQSNEPLVVIGARSAVFLPFARLGLVIVDEEHEPSYKQYDPAPRYNGRDAATMLAAMHGAKTLYGSATPTVETSYKARSGKFGLVELKERFAGSTLPEIEIVDLGAQRRSRSMTDGMFSPQLTRAVNKTVRHDGKQAILFHNRRGYAPMARCKLCQFVPKCDFCDVSLTYHRYPTEGLSCHYCGTNYPIPRVCPNCSEPAIEIVGFGTERLEEDLKENFSDLRVLRMDLDTTRNKDSYSKIIDEFSEHKADILVGTQMVTKGLDFKDVNLVGVLNADALINFPDFRSAERAFNMLEQVGGRSGRSVADGGDGARVIIQTYNPEHPVIQFAAQHNYEGFYEHELAERRQFGYPPFMRIIDIYVKHRDAATVQSNAQAYAARLRETLGQRVSAVKEPPVSRVNSLFIRKIMLKVEPAISVIKVKEILRQAFIELSSSPTTRGLTVYYDVDPV